MFILPFIKNNPIRRTPWVLIAIILANAMVLVGEYFNGNDHALFLAHGFVPAHPSIATALSSMFLHSGFWHFAGNMFFLWMFGNRVENLLGRWLFAGAYLLSGFGATAFYYLLNLHSPIPCVGASGAVSGVAGIFLILFPEAEFDLTFYFGWFKIFSTETRALAAVLAWFAEQTVLAVLSNYFRAVGGVAYWAHFGGFLVGMAIGLVFRLWASEEILKEGTFIEPEDLSDALQPNPGSFTDLKL